MKPRAFKLLAVFLPCLLACFGIVTGLAAVIDTPPPLDASPTATPAPSAPPPAAASPAATAKPGKKPKSPKDPNATPRVKLPKKPKEIPFPLPVNNTATDIVIPENSSTGTLLMKLLALKATRVSNEMVQLNETHVDVNHPDGSEDFHIDLPASVFNLQTHIIASQDPVTVRTQDFELTGEKMEFNTVDRTGNLVGHVHMHIHNLKQVGGLQQPQTP